MRALRKEPQHRYNSIEQLASDVRRYLTREPVQARQGNWLYYSQRFIRRHAFGVAAGAAFVVFIIAFAVSMSIQTQRVAAERDRATGKRDGPEVPSSWSGCSNASQPRRSLGRQVTARELLDEAGRRIRGDLSQQPEVRARLLEAIGRAYRLLEHAETAVPYLEDALRIRKQLPDPGGSKTAVGPDRARSLHCAAGRPVACRQRPAGGTGDQPAASRPRSRDLRKTAAEHRPRADDASATSRRRAQNFEESLALTRELSGPMHPEVGNCAAWSCRACTCGTTTWPQPSALPARPCRSTLPPASRCTRTASCAEIRLGEVLMLQGRINEADPSVRRIRWPCRRSSTATNSVQVADVLDSLARIRSAQGSLPEAEDYRPTRVAQPAKQRGHGTSSDRLSAGILAVDPVKRRQVHRSGAAGARLARDVREDAAARSPIRGRVRAHPRRGTAGTRQLDGRRVRADGGDESMEAHQRAGVARGARPKAPWARPFTVRVGRAKPSTI